MQRNFYGGGTKVFNGIRYIFVTKGKRRIYVCRYSQGNRGRNPIYLGINKKHFNLVDMMRIHIVDKSIQEISKEDIQWT